MEDQRGKAPDQMKIPKLGDAGVRGINLESITAIERSSGRLGHSDSKASQDAGTHPQISFQRDGRDDSGRYGRGHVAWPVRLLHGRNDGSSGSGQTCTGGQTGCGEKAAAAAKPAARTQRVEKAPP